jgi:hypothetical protein
MPWGVESSAEFTGASYFFGVEEYLSLSLEVFNERLTVLLSVHWFFTRLLGISVGTRIWFNASPRIKWL